MHRAGDNDKSAIYSPHPSTELPKENLEFKEPFPDFDNDMANRLLEDITPVPFPTLHYPELADSFVDSDYSPENIELEAEENLVQTVESSPTEVKTKSATIEKFDVEVGVEPTHQVQTKVAVVEEVDVEVANIAKSVDKDQVNVTDIEEIEAEVETDIAELASAIDEVDSTPVASPKSTTPDLNLTPRSPLQLTIPPAVKMAIQIAPMVNLAPTPIPSTTPAKTPNFFE